MEYGVTLGWAELTRSSPPASAPFDNSPRRVLRKGNGAVEDAQVFAGSGVGDPTLPVPLSDTNTANNGDLGMLSALSNVSTLDEEVMTTLMRDVRRVADNIRLVLLPKSAAASERRGGTTQRQVLRQWDLWGPFLFVTVLASLLAVGADEPSHVFSLMFTVMCISAVVLNLNIVLLGGKIVFLQSLALIGYCLFPMDIAALLCLFWGNAYYRVIVLAVGVGWSCYASLPTLGAAVAPARRALAVYPVVLLFLSIAWITLVL